MWSLLVIHFPGFEYLCSELLLMNKIQIAGIHTGFFPLVGGGL